MNYKHGKKGTRIYRIWDGMKRRCYQRNSVNFHHYGGRGIIICDRWKEFSNFYKDMGDPPSLKHTIDRIDNDGNYEPGNCRWATMSEQLRNYGRSRKVEIAGITLNMIDWCSILCVVRTGYNMKAHERLTRRWTERLTIAVI